MITDYKKHPEYRLNQIAMKYHMEKHSLTMELKAEYAEAAAVIQKSNMPEYLQDQMLDELNTAYKSILDHVDHDQQDTHQTHSKAA